ncbi:MerR family transcriptional regulator [Nonomuraea sp. FMUSA5-5]|uniref:MerR family transcriptional regulator n=1 Tax=Nonomuraea composti TaxID=2720023 RepID=A0ABX1BLJ9_9ACTN|nr:MerR family transcriptional regulator [Nonomuraea sp. FMUSA5-5]NJP98618.1 MerR family transcriptional regulator [Nonomuraea sp. FMUSA5-5]
MLIGELARRSSVSTRLLRYYEAQGLLTSVRLANGYRDYADDAPMIVAQIRGLLAAGLSTEVIRELLPCAAGKQPRLTSCPDLVGILRETLRDIDERMEVLDRNRQALIRYLDAAEAGQVQPPAATSRRGSRRRTVPVRWKRGRKPSGV